MWMMWRELELKDAAVEDCTPKAPPSLPLYRQRTRAYKQQSKSSQLLALILLSAIVIPIELSHQDSTNTTGRSATAIQTQ